MKACLVLLIAFACCTACSKSTRNAPPKNLQELRRSQPRAIWHDVTYVMTDSAKLKSRLTAPYVVERLEGPSSEVVRYFDRGFKLQFYRTDGALESTITANKGEFYETSGRAVARGNVVLVSAKNEQLKTEELTWLQATDKIRTDKNVTITTADEILYGEGMEANSNFSEYTIFKLKGTVRLKD
jgi:LPS export ABC transporter protein LptC